MNPTNRNMHSVLRLSLYALRLAPLALLLFFACGEREETDAGKVDTSSGSLSESGKKDTAGADTVSSNLSPLKLVAQRIRLNETKHLVKEKEFTLNIPEGFAIAVAAEGLKRVRFMAFSPDRRLFVTDMHDLSDNRIGVVYALDDFNPATKRFERRTTYLQNLRNPNSIAFHTDGDGRSWLYVALTDRLVRYRYEPGSSGPTGEPQTLATFPDYGKSYREGGWHLTRTVTFGGKDKLYVSVGSSCNVCEEKEEVRACVVEMNADGSDQRIVARGLRNAVGIRWIDDALWISNMGADHLGLDKPDDTFYRLSEGKHYGWPYAYAYQGEIYSDPVYGELPNALSPADVPKPWGIFPAHSAPLGFDRFHDAGDPALNNTFLVALHGSGAVAMKRGYSIVRLIDGKPAGDFINGFLKGTERCGRPCDILRDGPASFFFTDDHAGVVYYVYKVEGEG